MNPNKFYITYYEPRYYNLLHKGTEFSCGCIVDLQKDKKVTLELCDKHAAEVQLSVEHVKPHMTHEEILPMKRRKVTQKWRKPFGKQLLKLSKETTDLIESTLGEDAF